MNRWQKEIIRKNLPELLENTVCTTELLSELLSKGMLSDYDVDKINTNLVKNDKSKLLYDLLMTRDNGYAELLRALYKCKQTGAVKLLLEGHITHLIESPSVNFQGKIGFLRDFFPQLDNLDLNNIRKSIPINQETIDFVCDSSSGLKLCHETIPPPPHFYIMRSISNKLQLHPDIFKEERNDVFVFKGIEKQKLSFLVQPNLVLFSHRQLVEFGSRFILLEESSHWLEIRKIPGCPIHLIQYESLKSSDGQNSENFILEETIGNSKILLKFLKSPDKKAYISETELLDQLETGGNGICICDTPGMGKSWVLASLARKVLQRNHRSLVGFIALSELDKYFKPGETKPTQFSAIDILLDFLATCPLSKCVFKKAWEKNCLTLEIFADGLDEVSSDHLEATLNFLKVLVSNKSHVKLYVASRPHVQRELECSLSVVAYNILPFTEQNQVEFLVETWMQILQNFDENKLKYFAKTCLHSLRKNIPKNEHDIYNGYSSSTLSSG